MLCRSLGAVEALMMGGGVSEVFGIGFVVVLGGIGLGSLAVGFWQGE